MFKFLCKLFGFNKTNTVIEAATDPMKKFLIVGLGNIGGKYHNTRHNIGFKILDFLVEEEEVSFNTQKLGDVATFKFKGRTFILSLIHI